jgi:hypothetical protein
MVFLPFIYCLLCILPPQLNGLFYYIILGEGGWDIELLALSDLVVGLIYSFGFLIYLNKIKGAKFHRLVVVGQIVATLGFALYLPWLFIRRFPKGLFFAIRWFVFTLQSLGADLLIVPIVGRISKVLPEGFESTGVTVAISFYNLSGIINGDLSGYQIKTFGCVSGYFDRTRSPYLLNLGFMISLIAASPLFLSWG